MRHVVCYLNPTHHTRVLVQAQIQCVLPTNRYSLIDVYRGRTQLVQRDEPFQRLHALVPEMRLTLDGHNDCPEPDASRVTMSRSSSLIFCMAPDTTSLLLY